MYCTVDRHEEKAVTVVKVKQSLLHPISEYRHTTPASDWHKSRSRSRASTGSRLHLDPRRRVNIKSPLMIAEIPPQDRHCSTGVDVPNALELELPSVPSSPDEKLQLWLKFDVELTTIAYPCAHRQERLGASLTSTVRLNTIEAMRTHWNTGHNTYLK